jgi:hypothetical protein
MNHSVHCDDPAMTNTKGESAAAPGVRINWAPKVADHDYAAAEAYLSIKFADQKVAKLIDRLRAAPLTTRRANDILRATGLTAAPLDDPGVVKDLIKVIEGKQLSPVLVVGGKRRAEIADGYHRVSLIYRIDPYSEVPLKLA